MRRSPPSCDVQMPGSYADVVLAGTAALIASGASGVLQLEDGQVKPAQVGELLSLSEQALDQSDLIQVLDRAVRWVSST